LLTQAFCKQGADCICALPLLSTTTTDAAVMGEAAAWTTGRAGSSVNNTSHACNPGVSTAVRHCEVQAIVLGAQHCWLVRCCIGGGGIVGHLLLLLLPAAACPSLLLRLIAAREKHQRQRAGGTIPARHPIPCHCEGAVRDVMCSLQSV
jgi:hypothetical protein